MNILYSFCIIFLFGIIIYDLSENYIQIRYLFPFFLLFFSLVVACRNPSEHDTSAYVDFFNNIQQGVLYNKDIRFEKGFQILSYILKLLSFNSFRLYFFYIVWIVLFFLNKATKNIFPLLEIPVTKNNCFLFDLMFLCYFGVFYLAITIRSGIALSIVIYANSLYLNKRKFLIPILLLVFATTMHTSVAIFGLAVFVYFLIVRKTPSKELVIILCIVTSILYFGNLTGKIFVSFVQNPLFRRTLRTINPALEDMFRLYLSLSFSTVYGISKRYILYYLFEIIFIFHFVKYEDNKYYGIFLLIYEIGLLIMSGGRVIAQIERVSDFFVVYQVYLLCKDMNRKKILQSKYLYYFSFCGIIFLQLLFSSNLFNMGLLEKFQR